jgi:hypothetical protein
MNTTINVRRSPLQWYRESWSCRSRRLTEVQWNSYRSMLSGRCNHADIDMPAMSDRENEIRILLGWLIWCVGCRNWSRIQYWPSVKWWWTHVLIGDTSESVNIDIAEDWWWSVQCIGWEVWKNFVNLLMGKHYLLVIFEFKEDPCGLFKSNVIKTCRWMTSMCSCIYQQFVTLGGRRGRAVRCNCIAYGYLTVNHCIIPIL